MSFLQRTLSVLIPSTYRCANGWKETSNFQYAELSVNNEDL